VACFHVFNNAKFDKEYCSPDKLSKREGKEEMCVHTQRFTFTLADFYPASRHATMVFFPLVLDSVLFMMYFFYIISYYTVRIKLRVI